MSAARPARVWGSIAWSTVWKTPTSELVVLIVPVNAASSNTGKLEAVAKARPPAAMRTAMVATVRRRPYRSAMRDQPIVIAADPPIAAPRTIPIWVASRPRRSRYTPRVTARYP